jgi:1,4-dihydroxy-2-naphthoate polyprenyltransferase
MNFVEKLPAPARAWYMAARPRSLTATYAPLLIGAAVTLVDQVFDPIRFILSLIGALLLQIGANLVNEYVDFTRGTDAQKTAGMGMVLTHGHLTAQQVLIGAVVTIVGGVLIGLLLLAGSGILLLWIGLGGVLVAVLYTAGPFPLAYIGLGELAVFIFMGPAMTLGTYYAVSAGKGEHLVMAALAGLPIAFTVANILHANNMRDYEADKAANKRTLAVRFGQAAARREYMILTYGAYITTAVLILFGVIPFTTLIAFYTLPEAIQLVRQGFTATDPAVLHRLQGMSAKHHFRFGLALAFGWLVYWLLLFATGGIR